MKADFEKYMNSMGYDYGSYDHPYEMENLINQFAEEYAKKEAIEFGEFIELCQSVKDPAKYTIEEYYQEYLTQKK